MIVVGNLAIDTTLSGTLQIEVTQGWQFGPDQFSIQIPPLESRAYRVALSSGGVPEAGCMLARVEARGATWFEVARQGDDWMQLDVRRGEREIVVELENDMGITARGDVALVSAPRHWPVWQRWRGIEGAAPAIHPASQPLEIPAFSRRELRFRATGDLPADPSFFIRVAANGEMRLLPIP